MKTMVFFPAYKKKTGNNIKSRWMDGWWMCVCVVSFQPNEPILPLGKSAKPHIMTICENPVASTVFPNNRDQVRVRELEREIEIERVGRGSSGNER